MVKQLPKSLSVEGTPTSYCDTCGNPSHCGMGYTTQYKDYDVDGGLIREVQVCKHCNCKQCRST